MNLNQPKPGHFFTRREQLPEVLRYLLTKVQFVPNIRHALGWRDMVLSERFKHTWTQRIEGCAGIFGVHLDEVELHPNDWARAIYRITYFPKPGERILRHFSITARHYVTSPDYEELLREFAANLDCTTTFEVGRFSLTSAPNNNLMVLGLQGLSRRRVTMDRTEQSSESNYASTLVDEDLPAFTLAYQLFKVLAASFTYVMGEAPVQLNRSIRSGWCYHLTSSGDRHEIPSTIARYHELQLCYGDLKQLGSQLFNKPGLTEAIRFELWRDQALMPRPFRDELWWKAHDPETLSALNKRNPGFEERPQLFVLNGFSGSGKSSFLQNFVEYQVQHHRFVAILQKEGSEVDTKQLTSGYAVTALNDDTVRCSLTDDPGKAVEQILSSFHPDVVIFETSGTVNASGLQSPISSLEDLVRFDSVTTIVDAEQFERSIAKYDVVIDQILAADVIILNKTDLATEAALVGIEHSLREINPHALIVQSQFGDVDQGLLYEFDLGDDDVQPTLSSQPRNGGRFNNDKLSCQKLECSHQLSTKLLIAALEKIPPNVFRIKGIVDLVGAGATLIQFAGGRFYLTAFNNSQVTERFLIVIGQNLSPVMTTLRSLFFSQNRGTDSHEVAIEATTEDYL